MNIVIPDTWLRDYLRSDVKPKELSGCLSLSGPSVEKVEKVGSEHLYSIEVTTNRIDAFSVYGIAREAAAILPQFGKKAILQPLKLPPLNFSNKVGYLEANVDKELCPRFTAVLVRNVKIAPSPEWMKQRLIAVGLRPINNIVDISNYIMFEIGQPLHTFDYDKIRGAKMILRKSKKGEKLTTLDGKTHTLAGGDIVIEDGEGRLIDLAGIMGGENSMVDSRTKNVLVFVQTYNPVNIRATSMTLAQRTEAANIFEKDLDPELVTLGVGRAIELFEKLTGGKPEKEILNIYPKPYTPQKVETSLDFISQRLGIDIPKAKITEILRALGFEVSWKGNNLRVLIPSFRAKDITIPEDIVEEVARLYGYHNLPASLMPGILPEPLANSPFTFEAKVKDVLRGWGGVEVYTLSLVDSQSVNQSALRLKNPLGEESEYLRTSLMPSLIKAAKENRGEKEGFHLFEMANVYLPRKNNLPQEKMTLAGIFANTSFREAKGIVEGLCESLNIKWEAASQEKRGFLPNRYIDIKSGGRVLGGFGELPNGFLYYEFDVEALRAASKEVGSFKPLPKYPAQIEDITISIPRRTKIGELTNFVLEKEKLVSRIELTDIFNDSYTFRLWYQHPSKTLTDKEVKSVREKVLKEIRNKYGAILKD